MTRSEFAQYTQLSDKLATLKRQHKQLRAAVVDVLTECDNAHEGDDSRLDIELVEAPLRAALDATPTAPEHVIDSSMTHAQLQAAYDVLRAAAERVLDSWDTDEDVNESHLALRAALDATASEPANPSRDLVSAVRGALGKLRHSNVWAIEDTREILENALSKQGQDL